VPLYLNRIFSKVWTDKLSACRLSFSPDAVEWIWRNYVCREIRPDRFRAWKTCQVCSGIIVVYLMLAVLFAAYTPAWQAPDERLTTTISSTWPSSTGFRAQAGRLSALYLEEIKAARFPPEMSIAPVRYEFHQPPLYYLLAVPV